VENVSFFVEDLQSEIAESNSLKGINKVLLDPPRSGAEAMVKRLAGSDVSRVVYVSCNPETLARDIAILENQGFELKSAGIIDMFPHTTHVESIALLVR
jgi:23S rRNA (uracil1939-C5)-methyltransferase